jgi:hypothetical protein
VPSPVQKTINANIGEGARIDKVETFVVDGQQTYRATLLSPGGTQKILNILPNGMQVEEDASQPAP